MCHASSWSWSTRPTFHSLLQYDESVGDLRLQLVDAKGPAREEKAPKGDNHKTFSPFSLDTNIVWSNAAIWAVARTIAKQAPASVRLQPQQNIPAELLGHLRQHVLEHVLLLCRHKDNTCDQTETTDSLELCSLLFTRGINTKVYLPADRWTEGRLCTASCEEIRHRIIVSN